MLEMDKKIKFVSGIQFITLFSPIAILAFIISTNVIGLLLFLNQKFLSGNPVLEGIVCIIYGLLFLFYGFSPFFKKIRNMLLKKEIDCYDGYYGFKSFQYAGIFLIITGMLIMISDSVWK